MVGASPCSGYYGCCIRLRVEVFYTTVEQTCILRQNEVPVPRWENEVLATEPRGFQIFTFPARPAGPDRAGKGGDHHLHVQMHLLCFPQPSNSQLPLCSIIHALKRYEQGGSGKAPCSCTKA
ncbi:Hypothetical protein NTJ_15714 [Nesidiocoris tenuis]|uniref:Uncharacterized protein n=1 Tax=Nesidiocoris tenuis TaxID=355587 RepID=A0ABN7BET8_9HEMI|nr:Hypothetical protein NTJ_15714 [Nesidiocoris tenuis]